jgi:glycosyltransferase involved in cell wall biosynthesis
MNIGIDVRKLRDYGIGTYIRDVILYAAAGDSTNRYFLFGDPAGLQMDSNQFVWIPDSSAKYSLQELFSLSKKASEQNIDLFHSPHFTLPFRLKCKAVVTIHDLIHLKMPQLFPYWRVKAAEVVIRNAINKAEVILTVSKTSRDDIVNYFPAARGRVEVIYNRLSKEWQEGSDPEENRKKLKSIGISNEFLLYVGNFKKHKGIDTLVAAYSLLKDPPPLVLAGKSSDMDPEVSDTIFSNSRIRVLGFTEGRLLKALYSEALLFIFPSLYEGFGYPPLEAMSCKTPVLSSDAPALKEVLADGAEYFECGNSAALMQRLQALLDDSSGREQLAARGKQRASNFMTDDSARKLLQIYNRYSP